ncbi:MAG TPA: hypothetical protein VFQ96_01060, partial [Microbacteriaceae bacterium]|nr:hypothetical protein [Microbacteriaceae bacterium]
MSGIAICAPPRELARLSAALTRHGYRVRARTSLAAGLLAAMTEDLPGGGRAVDAVVADADRRCLTAELIGYCDRRGIRVIAVAAGSQGRRRAARLGLFEVVDLAEGEQAVARLVSAPRLGVAPAPASGVLPGLPSSGGMGVPEGALQRSGPEPQGVGRPSNDADLLGVTEAPDDADLAGEAEALGGVDRAERAGRVGQAGLVGGEWGDLGAAEEPPRGEAGRVIAVWGGTGAPGRTTIAVGLAGEYAARGEETALCDVDPYGGSIATLLGLLDEAP